MMFWKEMRRWPAEHSPDAHAQWIRRVDDDGKVPRIERSCRQRRQQRRNDGQINGGAHGGHGSGMGGKVGRN